MGRNKYQQAAIDGKVKKVIKVFVIFNFVIALFSIFGSIIFDVVEETKLLPDVRQKDSSIGEMKREDFPEFYHLVEGVTEESDTAELVLIDDVWEATYQELGMDVFDTIENSETKVCAIYWQADLTRPLAELNHGFLHPITKFDDYPAYYSYGQEGQMMPIPNGDDALSERAIALGYYWLKESEYSKLMTLTQEPLALDFPHTDSIFSFTGEDNYIAVYEEDDDWGDWNIEDALDQAISERYVITEFYLSNEAAQYKFSPVFMDTEAEVTIDTTNVFTLSHDLVDGTVYLQHDNREIARFILDNSSEMAKTMNAFPWRLIIGLLVTFLPLIFIGIFTFGVIKTIRSARNKNSQAKQTSNRVDDYYQTANDYSQQEFKEQEFVPHDYEEHSYDDVYTYEEHPYDDREYTAYSKRADERAKYNQSQMSTKDKNGPFWIDE